MKNIAFVISVLLSLASIAAHADECQVHSAYATSGTATVSTAAGYSAQNGVVAYAFFNPFVCTTTGVAFAVKTVDSLHHYGFALVGVNGNATPGQVYATTGALTGTNFTQAGANNVQSLAWSGGSHSLPVGVYMLMLGTDCSSSCAAIYGDAALGQFYPFIYADTSGSTPWIFSSSSGFCNGSSCTAPSVSIPLSTTATQTISGTTATVTLNTLIIGHIYAGATISVSGVTGSGVGLNCTSCTVTLVTPTTGKVEYTVPSGSFSGTVSSGSLSVSPVLETETGSQCLNNANPCFVAPTVLIY